MHFLSLLLALFAGLAMLPTFTFAEPIPANAIQSAKRQPIILNYRCTRSCVESSNAPCNPDGTCPWWRTVSRDGSGNLLLHDLLIFLALYELLRFGVQGEEGGR